MGKAAKEIGEDCTPLCIGCEKGEKYAGKSNFVGFRSTQGTKG